MPSTRTSSSPPSFGEGRHTDAPILASVIAARPDYFLTGDEDLLSIRPGRRLSGRILRSTDFLVEYLRKAGPRLQENDPDLYLKLLLYVSAA